MRWSLNSPERRCLGGAHEVTMARLGAADRRKKIRGT
jgi:hypothetical protein